PPSTRPTIFPYTTLFRSSIVDGVIDIVQLSLNKKSIKIKKEIAKDLPLFWGDEQRIVQILFNLIHNAVKYTDNGYIIVRAQTSDDYAIIEIEDTGRGISEDKLTAIFNPYERANIDEE